MTPIVTPEQMRAIDAAAPEPVEVLIERAGAAVARDALRMLGGAYGRTVNAVVGTGNNGADGRVAAERLRRRGVRVREFDALRLPPALPPADLVIDAAFGTGFRGTWDAPDVGTTPVLAVDVPSGLDALTGVAGPGVLAADRTVTFQALKPGMLIADGPAMVGEVTVADIGLDVSSARCGLVDAPSVGRWWPRRTADAHKWRNAVLIVAGSSSMPGAAHLASAGALRSGAGIVRLVSPRRRPGDPVVAMPEVVAGAVAPESIADVVRAERARFGALVVGPGLGRSAAVMDAVRRCLVDVDLPVVVDGDGLFACAEAPGGVAEVLASRSAPTVLTPHDGEFRLLTGAAVPDDRVAGVCDAASRWGVVVLLKGPTTVVASSDRSLLVDRGDQRLATPGSGDVLAGMIGAALAGTVSGSRSGDQESVEVAAAAAYLHAEAGRLGPAEGLVASDLADSLPDALARCRAAT